MGSLSSDTSVDLELISFSFHYVNLESQTEISADLTNDFEIEFAK